MQSKRSGIVWLVQAVIQDLVGGSVKAARGKFTWQELFQLVHFVNFAVNFFVYSCCGRQFFYTKIRNASHHHDHAHFWTLSHPKCNASFGLPLCEEVLQQF